MCITRRNFLGTTALGGAAGEFATQAGAAEKAALPVRALGRTGAKVSLLAFGCGSRWTEYGTADQALATLTRAIDLGITYIDTAAAYGDGQSEKIVGTLMKSRRKEVWLATKIRNRQYDEFLRLVDESLKRLETGQVDLLHIHDLQGVDDLTAIESPRGALKALYRIRDEKKARFIGITSHSKAEVLRAALERHDFDCVQMSLNPALQGKQGMMSFESLALPAAVQKKMGVLAMKVFAQARYKAPAAGLIRYALTLPVSSAAIGMPSREVLEENVRIASAFQPLPDSEMKQMAAQLSAAHKRDLEHFFRHHVDS